jgi:hypothetical protein
MGDAKVNAVKATSIVKTSESCMVGSKRSDNRVQCLLTRESRGLLYLRSRSQKLPASTRVV